MNEKWLQKNFRAEDHEFIRVVLALVNEGRAALGLPNLDELPKGAKDTCHCPLALAFDQVDEANGMHSRPDIISGEHGEAICSDFAEAEKLSVAWFGFSEAEQYRDGITVALPEMLASFINRFDEGEFPKLLIPIESIPEELFIAPANPS